MSAIAELRMHLCKIYEFIHTYLHFFLASIEVWDFSLDFPDGSAGRESAWNAGDLGLISGLGRSPGEGNGNPLQYSGLENPMEELDTTEWFSLSLFNTQHNNNIPIYMHNIYIYTYKYIYIHYIFSFHLLMAFSYLL